MLDVQERLSRLKEHYSELELYALVDGLQYEQEHEERLQPGYAVRSLFANTPDEPLQHAGPWLIAIEQAQNLIPKIAILENNKPAVTWLISSAGFEGLAMLLQLRLDTQLADGTKALLRYWDPRVLAGLVGIMTPEQREDFFSHIHEWHLMHQGQRVWIGRHHANT